MHPVVPANGVARDHAAIATICQQLWHELALPQTQEQVAAEQLHAQQRAS
jgi:hypothetical protein